MRSIQIQFQMNSRTSTIMNHYQGKQDATNITIRLASPSDAIALAKLRYALRVPLDRVHENDESFLERCRFWMQARLHNDGRWKCWIAEREGMVVGNLWAQLIEQIPNPTSEPEYYVYFTNFYVLREFRGSGVGSRLFTAALNWSRSKSVHAGILWPTERSRTLYSRYGFSVGTNLMELTFDNSAN